MKIDIKKILCPIDFSTNAAYATRYALAFAEAHGAELLLLQVEDPHVTYGPTGCPDLDAMPMFPSEDIEGIAENSGDEEADTDQDLERLAAKLRGAHPSIEISASDAEGTPFMEIVRSAKEQGVDLIVMGTHGRTGLAHMLIGSTAERVVRMAPCPVLTVKHPEHEFVMP